MHTFYPFWINYIPWLVCVLKDSNICKDSYNLKVLKCLTSSPWNLFSMVESSSLRKRIASESGWSSHTVTVRRESHSRESSGARVRVCDCSWEADFCLTCRGSGIKKGLKPSCYARELCKYSNMNCFIYYFIYILH